ncbi:MAG: ABC transporter ATP-binding protein [Bacillota bacterium]|nr:ABC transporter ATP-binding protein [Bacillota bacterium]
MLGVNIFLSFSLVLDPVIVAIAVDRFIKMKNTVGLYGIGALSLSIAILVSLVVYFFFRIAFKIEAHIGHKFRRDQFAKVQLLAVEYFDKTPVGSIISRMGADTGRVSEVVAWGILDLAWAGGYLFLVTISMLAANWKLALVVLTLMPILIFITWLLSVRVLKLERQVRSANSKMTSAISDGIYGAKTSKVLCREELNCQEFSDITREMRQKSIYSARLSSAYFPVPLAVSSIAIGLVIYFGGNMVKTGEITIGVVMLFISYANMMFDPVIQMIDITSQLVKAHAAAERILELIETEPTIVDRPDVIEKYGTIEHPLRDNWEDMQGDITFENVSFAYKKGEYILKDFNLHIPRGTTVALVGKTGAGKTTIVNLACRFYEPTEGRILIDGVDYRERSQSWLHNHLGYVLQSPFLFTGTIADNIKYGKMDATEEEIIAAAKLVHAHDFIVQFERGYETQVGEGGSLLSGGQKQLISFARAVLRSPQLFVLDEATSSVDTETEKILQLALEELLKDRTSFIVAHRLSTIKNADLILVVDQGAVAERGTHAELMARKGKYYKLYTNQKYDEGSSRLLKTPEIVEAGAEVHG